MVGPEAEDDPLVTAWRRIEEVLRQRHVTDVLVPGFVDRDELPVPVFRPQPLVVHVVLDEGVLRLESVGQYDQLAWATSSSVSWGSSCSGTAGRGCGARTCARTRTPARTRPGASSSASLELGSRYWLFLDPTWTFGIRIGNAEDMRRWEKDHWRRPTGARSPHASPVTSTRAPARSPHPAIAPASASST